MDPVSSGASWWGIHIEPDAQAATIRHAVIGSTQFGVWSDEPSNAVLVANSTIYNDLCEGVRLTNTRRGLESLSLRQYFYLSNCCDSTCSSERPSS